MNRIHLCLRGRRKRWIDHHTPLAARLCQPDRPGTVACLLKQDKVLGIGLAGLHHLPAGVHNLILHPRHRRGHLPGRQEVCGLRQIEYPIYPLSLPGTESQFRHRLLCHAVYQQVGTAGDKNRRLQGILPVVVVHQPPH